MIVFMSSHSKVKTAELFDTTESAYNVASWFGMLDIMNTIGSLEKTRLSAITDIGSHAVRVCENVARKPDHLLNNLYTWRLNLSRRTALQRIGIYDTAGDIDQAFETASDIYVDNEWQTEIIKNTEFGELLLIAKDLAVHYTPQALAAVSGKNGFDEKFRNIHRDVNFYVGSYDPDR
jgi:hypothetical protein